jgi:hypothetical protein
MDQGEFEELNHLIEGYSGLSEMSYSLASICFKESEWLKKVGLEEQAGSLFEYAISQAYLGRSHEAIVVELKNYFNKSADIVDLKLFVLDTLEDALKSYEKQVNITKNSAALELLQLKSDQKYLF